MSNHTLCQQNGDINNVVDRLLKEMNTICKQNKGWGQAAANKCFEVFLFFFHFYWKKDEKEHWSICSVVIAAKITDWRQNKTDL